MKEIADKFDVGVTAIGEASKRIQKKMEEDKELQMVLGSLATKSIRGKWRLDP